VLLGGVSGCGARCRIGRAKVPCSRGGWADDEPWAGRGCSRLDGLACCMQSGVGGMWWTALWPGPAAISNAMLAVCNVIQAAPLERRRC